MLGSKTLTRCQFESLPQHPRSQFLTSIRAELGRIVLPWLQYVAGCMLLLPPSNSSSLRGLQASTESTYQWPVVEGCWAQISAGLLTLNFSLHPAHFMFFFVCVLWLLNCRDQDRQVGMKRNKPWTWLHLLHTPDSWFPPMCLELPLTSLKFCHPQVPAFN